MTSTPTTTTTTTIPSAKRARQSITLQRLPLGSDVSLALDTAIQAAPSVEDAILHLMHTYDFDLGLLKELITTRGLNVSFSRVKFRSIAPLVGLDPFSRLADVEQFEVHRARIPNELFANIATDVQIAVNNYGLPEDHQNEEARSRLIASLFTRLVAEFKLLIINTPESVIEGRITTKGRIEYLFMAFGSLAMLFIEVKYRLNTGDEFLDAVAQVIAEADACDYINARNNLNCDVYGILCDGSAFHFFRYDHTQTPRISMGIFPFSKADSTRRQSLKLADLQYDSHLDFWRTARVIVEAIFYILLLSYERSLRAYYERSVAKTSATGKPRSSTPEWFMSLGFASKALTQVLKAGNLHAEGSVAAADIMALKAMDSLRESVMTAPSVFRRQDAQLVGGLDCAAIESF